MSRGVIYYNTGSCCLVRLLVSLGSLRKFYQGGVTILSEGVDSHETCRRIGDAFSADVIKWDCEVPEGKNRIYLAKTRYHLGTPYDTTIALDADTLVFGKIDQLFEEAIDGEFCVARFADWKSGEGVIAKRVCAWREWRPQDIERALNFGPAINCGVVAFQKESRFYKDWLQLALPGRETFIPDEVCCQLSLYRYPHRIVNSEWNCSCRYDNPNKAGTKIVHFHGSKHCRIGLPFHGELWMKEFMQNCLNNSANILNWVQLGDATLSRYICSLKAGGFSDQLCNEAESI